MVAMPMEKMMMGELRASIWQKVQGEKILEVGVGTGKNFPHSENFKIFKLVIKYTFRFTFDNQFG
jgi:hypothetical protein